MLYHRLSIGNSFGSGWLPSIFFATTPCTEGGNICVEFYITYYNLYILGRDRGGGAVGVIVSITEEVLRATGGHGPESRARRLAFEWLAGATSINGDRILALNQDHIIARCRQYNSGSCHNSGWNYRRCATWAAFLRLIEF